MLKKKTKKKTSKVGKKVAKKTTKKTAKKKVAKKTTKKKTKFSSMDDVLESMCSEFNMEVMDANSEDRAPYFIPFRHIGLQKITGGIPGGRMTEIHGDSQCGKSYLLYELGIETINMGGAFQLHDVERAYEPAYGRRVGLEGNKKFLLSPKKQMQEIFLTSRIFIKRIRSVDKTCPILVGVDSYSPIQIKISTDHMEKQMKNATAKEIKGYVAARKNMEFSQLIGDFVTFLEENDATFVLLNQTRKQMGVVFGDPITTNADDIIKFYSSLRLRGSLGKKLKETITGTDKKRKIGVKSSWETVKNRNVAPFKKVSTDIIYKTGVKRTSGLKDLLIAEGIGRAVPKKPSLIKVDGKVWAPSKFLKAHPDALDF